MGSSATWGLLTATFTASFVEFVEALTIVLAMGMTRSWRSALAGTGLALVTLAGFTVVAGYALVNWLPRDDKTSRALSKFHPRVTSGSPTICSESVCAYRSKTNDQLEMGISSAHHSDEPQTLSP